MPDMGEYDYNKFTKDSSDDYPKYADGISIDSSKEVFITAPKVLEGEETIKSPKTPSEHPQEFLKFTEALSHVLTLASERSHDITCTKLHSKAIEAIKIVKEGLYNYQNSNIVLSKDLNNK